MKPVVVRSINDADILRCVDILRTGGVFSWVECRRDPEDGSGWRRIGVPQGAFPTQDAAEAAARAAVAWMDG